ncbi:hypothetical protein NDU88_007349 [Pleurodeles waltl]|uniref:Uncharacterized protein n=1 Tax=Pleurodeles waltl TaxID=8319 RepID=A0AAV7PL38_PLEWA|nr:hypothetical protein NDU88_007349 [Pleurodeles waltl]
MAKWGPDRIPGPREEAGVGVGRQAVGGELGSGWEDDALLKFLTLNGEQQRAKMVVLAVLQACTPENDRLKIWMNLSRRMDLGAVSGTDPRSPESLEHRDLTKHTNRSVSICHLPDKYRRAMHMYGPRLARASSCGRGY